ncbi:MAG: hypothetical protein IJ083_17925 [Clostridia bacterium]|nr:hypothetical protein [Clostridia bacterium]
MASNHEKITLGMVLGWLKHLVIHQWPYKLLSLLCAVVVWVGLISQDASLTREKTFTDATVSVVGTDAIKRKGLIVTSDLGEETLSGVTLRASVPQTVYGDAAAANYNLRIDLSRITTSGSQEAKILWTNTASYGSVVEVSPTSIPIDVDEYITRYRIPVGLETIGNLPDGWYSSAMTMDPPYLAVSGPRSVVGSIVRAQAILDLSSLEAKQGTVRTAVPFNLIASDGSIVESELLEVTSESVLVDAVVVEQTLYPQKALSFSDLGVVVGDPAEGYEIKSVSVQPETVLAAGKQEALDQLEQLFTEAQVDVTGASSSFSRTVKLRKPSELVNLSTDTITVTVEIGETIQTRVFEAVRVNLEGTEQGYYESLSSRYADVSLTGPQNWLNTLNKGNLTLTADASGLTEGTYELPIVCVVSGGEDQEYTLSVNPQNVTVTLRKN